MSAFETAFAAARKAGKKEFKYNGKSYNTKLKSEGKSFAKTPKKGPIPESRTGLKAVPSKIPGRSFAGKEADARPAYSEMYSKGVTPTNKPLKGNVGGMAASPKSDRVPAKGLEARMGGDKPDAKKSAALKSAFIGSKLNAAKPKRPSLDSLPPRAGVGIFAKKDKK
jgi:hypothetical protein